MAKKTTSKELVELSKEVSPIVTKATELKIIDQPSMEQAVEFLSRLNQENDRLVEDREKLTVPINTALKEIRAKYKPATTILESAIELIRDKMSIYQTNLMAKRRKEEEVIAKKMSEGKLSMDKAIAKMDSLDVVQNKTETESGSIQFRTDYVVEITDKKLLPLEYLEPKESMISKDLKAGIVIPGAKLNEVLTPVNKR